MAFDFSDYGGYKCAPECRPKSRIAAGFLMRGDVVASGGNNYRVAGYSVYLCGEDDEWDGNCNCYDFLRYGAIFGRPCKHLWAVKFGAEVVPCR